MTGNILNLVNVLNQQAQYAWTVTSFGLLLLLCIYSSKVLVNDPRQRQ